MNANDLKYHPQVTEGYDEKGNSIYHPYCINDFIKELEAISEDKRKLPFGVFSPNGMFWKPKILMIFENYNIFDKKGPIAMTINYK